MSSALEGSNSTSLPRRSLQGGQRRRGSTPPHQPPQSSRGANKVRTSHACDRCRAMRTKCSGGEKCIKCIKDNAVCAYGDRKRERNKKDLVESLDLVGELREENKRLLDALRSIAENDDFDLDRHGDIAEILSQYTSRERSDSGLGNSSQSQDTFKPTNMSKSPRATGPRRRRSKQQGDLSGEDTAPSTVGSPGNIGQLTHAVDLDLGTGASGFIGKLSEMSWTRRAYECISEHPRPPHPGVGMKKLDQHIGTVKDFNYFLDDTDVLAVDEDLIDLYQLPPFQTSLILSEAYFHALQGVFPFVLREPFLNTLLSLPRQHSLPTWSERRWLAMANVMWAIGSKWLQMAKLEPPPSTDNHVVYYARARALGLDHRVVFDHPDIERVQSIGLLAFYLLINGSITRAWNTLGNATRHATALGLHLRVTDPDVDEHDRERRARTWYSLYSLEILIAEITGRPKSIFTSDVTTPITLFHKPKTDSGEGFPQADGSMSVDDSRRLWLDFLHARRVITQAMADRWMQRMSLRAIGQSVSPLYFPYRISLCHLSDKVASELFSGTSDDSWSDIQRKIGNLQTELSYWAEELPEELSIHSEEAIDTDPRVKAELSMYYHSVQMMLHRPCLCEVIVENESPASQEFNHSSARACVHAAMSMLATMPDQPNAHEVYQLLPWWGMLHYVAQAVAVFLLELSLDGQHFPDEIPELMNYLRKAMGYIWCMTEMSMSAYRAWRIFRRLLSEVLHGHQEWNMSDIPEDAPRPFGWKHEHEAAVGNTFAQE